MPIVTHPADNGPIGLILVDSRNSLNELKHLTMLWTICHCWSKGSCFSFNCYCCQLLILIQNRGKPTTISHGKGGITQGDPLAMLLYGTALTPLMELLQKDYPDVLPPWDADNASFISLPKRNE